MQSLQLLRAPLRHSSRRAFTLPNSRQSLSSRLSKSYSTSPPPSSTSKTPLFLALGVALVSAGGYYLYSTSPSASATAKEGASAVKASAQVARVKSGIAPSRDDYQVVYNRIAELLEEVGEEGYDGWFIAYL